MASELALRLAKAKDLIDVGKQSRALDELWLAEAHARGNEAALREMIEFTTGVLEEQAPSKLRRQLGMLVGTLRQDLSQIKDLPAVPSPAAGTDDLPFIFGMAVVGGIAGAVGAAVIIHTFFLGAYDPEGNLVGAVLIRMFLGFLVGATIFSLLALWFASWRSRRSSSAS